MFEKPLFIRAEWDEDVNVWVATSDDVPGLATEGDLSLIHISEPTRPY